MNDLGLRIVECLTDYFIRRYGVGTYVREGARSDRREPLITDCNDECSALTSVTLKPVCVGLYQIQCAQWIRWDGADVRFIQIKTFFRLCPDPSFRIPFWI